MTICSTCQATKTIPDCLTTLIIGAVPAATTIYYTYLKDVTTGRIERYESTSSGGKVLSITLTQRLSPSHAYELWVTLKSAASQENKEEVLISGEVDTLTCFSLSFESTFTEGAKNTFTSVTLTSE